MITLRSYAKINWYLRVLGRRADGFHDIETVFQEINLWDLMHFEPAEEIDCTIEGMPFELPAEQNLIWRAWKRLRDVCGRKVQGLRVRIEKRIPACGGLGGASSNAATTLCALNSLYELHLSQGELEALAADLGSDVAFFVRGGCAIGTGRGERLQTVERVPAWNIGLIFPAAKVATAEAYKRLSQIERPQPHATLQELIAALCAGDVAALARCIHNDFELLVRKEGWFEAAVRELEAAGHRKAFLSGSGSTVVGVKNALAHGISVTGREKHQNATSGVWETTTRPS